MTIRQSPATAIKPVSSSAAGDAVPSRNIRQSARPAEGRPQPRDGRRLDACRARVVTENGHRKRITKLDAAVKQLVNRAASGEARSMSLLLALIQAGEVKPLQTGNPDGRPIATSHSTDGLIVLLQAVKADKE